MQKDAAGYSYRRGLCNSKHLYRRCPPSARNQCCSLTAVSRGEQLRIPRTPHSAWPCRMDELCLEPSISENERHIVNYPCHNTWSHRKTLKCRRGFIFCYCKKSARCQSGHEETIGSLEERWNSLVAFRPRSLHPRASGPPTDEPR